MNLVNVAKGLLSTSVGEQPPNPSNPRLNEEDDDDDDDHRVNMLPHDQFRTVSSSNLKKINILDFQIYKLYNFGAEWNIPHIFLDSSTNFQSIILKNEIWIDNW